MFHSHDSSVAMQNLPTIQQTQGKMVFYFLISLMSIYLS